MLVNMRRLLKTVLGCASLWACVVGAGDITPAEEILKKLSGGDSAVARQTITLRGITPVPAAATVGSVAPKQHVIDLIIHFKTDSAQIAPGSALQIREIATALKQIDLTQKRVRIIGHTDSRGAVDHNAGLSLQRARAVRDTLVHRYGISLASLLAEGKGESQLLADPELSAADCARNRRVELQLIDRSEL